MKINKKNHLQANDFVTAVREIEGIEKQSVGIVKEIKGEQISVFFIGKKQILTTNIKNIKYLDLKLTGKPYKVKICNICHILKDDDDFSINQTDAKGRKTTRPSCKICRVDIDGVKLIPQEGKKLDKLKPENIFTCPICDKISIVGITANLVKDHDHKTGKAREWICDSCNTGLGRFKDDIKLLEKVIEYLKKYEKQ